MCGIFGIVSFNHKISEEILLRMKEILEIRGPDSWGIYISKDGKIGLGHTRLAIIDLTEKAKQPISNENHSIFLSFNGEIYNFKELRKELEKTHKFKSNSDAEVLLHLYEEEKEECIKKLRGVFSFCIYDENENKIFTGRDKFGVKPLYYYIDKNFFVFSSLLKAIKIFDFVEKELDLDSIYSFLCFGSIPYPLTIFKDIKILPPSSYLILKEKKLIMKKYFEIKPSKIFYKNYEDIKEKLYEILDESVRINLFSDVPLGILLSGGLDSSLILYFARKNNKDNLKTFSLIFEEKEYDEREDSRLISKFFDTEHYEYLINSKDMKKEIDRFLNFMDLPTIDGFNTYFISKFAKDEGLKVCLSGLGGDELFGGYRSFFNVPKLLKFKNLFPILKFLLRKDKKDKLNFFLLNPSFESAFFTLRGLFTPLKLKKILSHKEINFNPIEYLKNISETKNFENIIDKISILEIRTYMHNQLLKDTDNFSMCHPIEVRVPLLDEEILDFAFSIPQKYKINKKILKDLMKNYLPLKIINKKKKAFFFPMDKWLKSDLKDFVKEGIFGIRTFFEEKEMENLWKEFEINQIHWSRIWAIAILNHYLKINRLL